MFLLYISSPSRARIDSLVLVRPAVGDAIVLAHHLVHRLDLGLHLDRGDRHAVLLLLGQHALGQLGRHELDLRHQQHLVRDGHLGLRQLDLEVHRLLVQLREHPLPERDLGRLLDHLPLVVHVLLRDLDLGHHLLLEVELLRNLLRNRRLVHRQVHREPGRHLALGDLDLGKLREERALAAHRDRLQHGRLHDRLGFLLGVCRHGLANDRGKAVDVRAGHGGRSGRLILQVKELIIN